MSKIVSGVDLIEVERIVDALERHGTRFGRRVFTEQEWDFCAQDPRRLAGRFAVKEAVAKALGTGIGDMRWTDIEILCDARGKPELVLHAEAATIARAQGVTAWSISLSHTETHAVGLAVGVGS